MKNSRKGIVFLMIMVMVFGLFGMTGCGGGGDADAEATGWQYIEDKGTLIVGLDDTFAPMGFRDTDGNLVGFDIDLAAAVGEKLGVEIVFQPIDWDAKELELQSKKIDCIWNGMSATPERQESMALTDKYLNNKIVIMTLSEDVVISDVTALANYKIGTQAASAALETMQANDAWDIFSANISEYGDYDKALLDMKAGRIDCIVIDQVLGEYKNSKMDGTLFVTEYNFGDDFYAVGCRAEDTGVAEKITGAISDLIEEGKAKEISEKWFGKDIVILEGYAE